MHEFDFVALGSVDEGEAAAVRLEGRAIGEFKAEAGEVFAEFLEAVDFEGKMGEIGLDLDRAAVRKVAKLDEFLAFGGFHEDKFGTARGFVAADFLEAEDPFVKVDAFFEIVQAVARVQKFTGDCFHGVTIGVCPEERNNERHYEDGQGVALHKRPKGRTTNKGKLIALVQGFE